MTRRLLNKFLGLLFLSFFWINLNSQDSLYFENLTSNEKYVLIVGIENVLKFDPSVDNILFNAENVLKTGSIFKIKPNQVGAVSVMLFSGSAMKGSIDFEVKYSKLELLKNQNPEMRLGVLSRGGKVTKENLLQNLELKIYSGASATLSVIKVIEFDFTYVPVSGDIRDAIPHFSNLLNFKAIEYISQSKPKDIFLIENVKVRSTDGTIRKIPGLSYQIE